MRHHLHAIVQVEVVLLAMGAALLLALTSVVQQRAAAVVPHHKSLRPGLVVELVRSPLWVAGMATDAGAYFLQFLALRRGTLVLVQSVLVTGLLFALPFGAAWSHRRLSRSDWLGTLAVVAGLAVFLVTAGPERGRGQPTPAGWVVLLAMVGVVVAVLVLAAPPGPSKGRGLSLGAACGILFGLNAALTKACAVLLDHGGVVHLLGSWQLWVLVASAAYGFLLSQSAFQAGPLEASLPVLTISDPLVSAAIGLGVLHEHVAAGAGAVALEVAGAAAMVTGVLLLARSPLVAATVLGGHGPDPSLVGEPE
ncbi:MAG: DMT family transporter [Acidimicrobiales bacterium]